MYELQEEKKEEEEEEEEENKVYDLLGRDSSRVHHSNSGTTHTYM